MRQGSTNAIISAVSAYYDATLGLHGPSARGVDWKDEASHQLRHAQFLRLIGADPQASILDIGCGYGDFLDVVRQAGCHGRYVGCDVAPSMIETARRLHGTGQDRIWHLGATPPECCGFAIASGIFNVRRGAEDAAWATYVEDTIDLLAAHSRLGFGLNLLSLSSDPTKRRSDLYYADPVAMLELCLRRYGRQVALLQDYGLWEFTILVRHSQTASPIPVCP